MTLDDVVPLEQVPERYGLRFSEEHVLRFLKQDLLWTAAHVRTPEQFERWSWIVVLAFIQLYLARELGRHALLPWEAKGRPVTPRQVRRVMPSLLSQLGTPTRACQPRGKAAGRAKALGTLGEKSIAPKLLLLLSDPQIDPNVHASVVAALGELGEQSMLAEMQHLLSDTGINPGVRMNIVDAMSKIGDASLMPPLEKLLLDPQIDPNLLIHITQVLSNLDEQTAVSSLQQLRSRALVDQKTPWSITEALGRLGDDSVIPDLLQLLYQSSHEVFSMTAETLASLGDRSIVPELLELLADPQIDKEGRWSIASALGQLIDDEANLRTLVDFLQEPEIASPVLRALWIACRRVGVRIFKMDGLTGQQVEIEKWGLVPNL